MDKSHGNSFLGVQGMQYDDIGNAESDAHINTITQQLNADRRFEKRALIRQVCVLFSGITLGEAALSERPRSRDLRLVCVTLAAYNSNGDKTRILCGL